MRQDSGYEREGVATSERRRGLDSTGGPGAHAEGNRRTARVTGLWYLALGIAGMVGFLLIRPQIHVAGDAAATLANLVDEVALARTGLVMELVLVVAQALAAVWFYKLFRSFSEPAAWAVGAFGLVNAIAVLASAAFMATALAVAGDTGLAPGGDAAATVQLMYELGSSSWQVGGLFFGLWLIPMGYLAGLAGMPRWLGRILIAGGVGYLLSTFISAAIPEPVAWLVDGLVYPATIGEFWMIGYLLTVGIRQPATR